MRFRNLAALAILLLSTQFIFGQDPCGYRGKSSWLTWYQANRQQLVQSRGSDTSWLYVPVTLHIVGPSNAITLDAGPAVRAICNMNEQYADAHIRFFLMPGDPIRYLFNSEWNDHDFNGGADLITSNNLPGRMNAYLVANPAGNCGYSWLDAIVMGRGCSGPDNTTWAHEAGHHFSLPHPFVGWEGYTWDYSKPAPLQIGGIQVEKTDGSNCGQASDGFCDTKPDYLHYRWSCTDAKESTTIQIDPNGVQFRSDATLFMGYAMDACGSRFTPEQIEAMRFNIQTEHADYLNTEPVQANLPVGKPVRLLSPVDTTLVQFDNVTLEWEPLENATIYVVEVSFLQNFGATLFTKTVINDHKVAVNKALLNNRLIYWRVRAYNEWDICQPAQPVQKGVFKTQNLLASNDLERTLSSELSPNPVMSGASALLTLSTEEYMDALLTVTDAAGRQSFRQILRISPGENQLEIPTEALSAGLYVVMLQNEKGVILKRLAVGE